MNVALPAVLVFILLFPGFLTNHRYKQSERVSLDYAPFGDSVATAVVFALVLHSIWLLLGYCLFDQILDLSILLGLMSSDAGLQKIAVEKVSSRISWVSIYFLTIVFVPYFSLPFLRSLVVRYRLDTTRSSLKTIFRFDAPWYYIFGAHDLEIDVSAVIVTSVINVGGNAVIYRGSLVEYFLDRDGGLDRIVLELASRRSFSADSVQTIEVAQDRSDAERFYEIAGDYLVLRYGDMSSLNVEYLYLVETTPDDLASDSMDTKLIVEGKTLEHPSGSS